MGNISKENKILIKKNLRIEKRWVQGMLHFLYISVAVRICSRSSYLFSFIDRFS